MDTPVDTELSQRADSALRDILTATAEGAPLVTVASPPGAGKTFAIEVLAAQQAGIQGQVLAVATTTRAQAQALVERLAGWAGFTPVWFIPKSQNVIPPSGVTVVRSVKDFPEENAVIVATAAKWSRTSNVLFPLLVVDEAWQLPFATFASMAALAERFVLVGDPGQIAPVVRVDVSRWQDDPSGPHVPAPVALAARNIPGAVRVALPATRRLPADTAAMISEAFYPEMPFGSLAEPRSLQGSWVQGLEGGSLHVLEFGDPHVGQQDPLLGIEAARLASTLVRDGATVVTSDGRRTITPGDIGIVCSYVRQVPEVRAALDEGMSDVFVETANRWQGLERDVIIGLHPLSGMPEPTKFAMEAGRLCVMASRHRALCVLLGRPGLAEAAASSAGAAERHFGDAYDPSRLGWTAHARFLHGVGVQRL